MAASMLVARMLGREGFGEFGIVQSTVMMFGTLAGFGLGLTTTKHVAEFRNSFPHRASRILSLSGIVSWGSGGLCVGLLFLTASWLATETLKAPELEGAIRIGSFLVLFGAVNGAQLGALAGFEAFKRMAQLSVWGGLANFPFVIGGCRFFGLHGAIWGLVAAQAFGCALNRWALTREARSHGIALWSREWRQEFGVLWTFSIPALVAALVTAVARWMSHAIIVRQPDGMLAMATCTIGIQFQALILFLPGLITGVSLPIMSDLRGQGEAEKLRKFTYRNLKLNLAVTSAFCIPLALLSGPILRLYGPAYRGEETVFMLFLFAGILASGSRFAYQILASRDAMRFSLLSNFAFSSLLIGTVALLVEQGAMAFACAQVVAYSAHLLLPLAYIRYALDSALENGQLIGSSS